MPRKLFQFILPAILGLALVSCGNKHNESTNATRSLREGLLALDRGDDIAAEAYLTETLNEEPDNTQARTALASIYVQRAGLNLESWLEPLVSAGQRLQANAHTYRQLRELMIRLALDRKGPESTMPEITIQFTRVAVGIAIIMDIFQSMPTLDERNLGYLNQAITTLRQTSAAPANRPEQVRVYLAILSFVRLIHFSRLVLGATDQDLSAILRENSPLCRATLPNVRIQMEQIRSSLETLEEGLIVNPEEATNRLREARQRIHNSLKEHIDGFDWDRFSRYFEEGSAEYLSRHSLLRSICQYSVSSVAPSQASNSETNAGADLFNPDEPLPTNETQQ